MKNRELYLLNLEEMKEITDLPLAEKRLLIVAGYADFDIQQLVLFRGDGSEVITPFSIFEPSGTSSPNFHKLEITDCGNTLKLGEYEVDVRTILSI